MTTIDAAFVRGRISEAVAASADPGRKAALQGFLEMAELSAKVEDQFPDLIVQCEALAPLMPALRDAVEDVWRIHAGYLADLVAISALDDPMMAPQLDGLMGKANAVMRGMYEIKRKTAVLGSAGIALVPIEDLAGTRH